MTNPKFFEAVDNSERPKGSICQSSSTVSSVTGRMSVCSMQCTERSCDDVETRLALCVASDDRTLYNSTDCESSAPRPHTSRACPSTSAPCDVSPRWFTSSWNPVRLSIVTFEREQNSRKWLNWGTEWRWSPLCLLKDLHGGWSWCSSLLWRSWAS